MKDINVSTQLFSYCVEVLLGAFIAQIQKTHNSLNLEGCSEFRVPINIHYITQGSKIFIPSSAGKIQLSYRELECLQCLLNGLTAKETARILYISNRTVETYLLHIKEKLQCRTKGEIIRAVYLMT